MFYDVFKDLCNSRGISCNKAALEIGLSNATPTKWKKTGASPDSATLSKIAKYFSVSIDYLLGGDRDEDILTGESKFYDVYLDLCKRDGKKPSVVASELGINKSNVSNWKNNGYTPRGDALQHIADYFDVTTDYLLTGEQKEKPYANDDEELNEYLEELRTRPECRMLFKLAKGATKADVEKAVAIIEALRKTEE